MRYLLGLLLCLLPLSVLAQELTEEDYYYPYATYADLNPPPEPMPIDSLEDHAYYYQAIRLADDSYDRLARFTLPRVRISRRGESYTDRAATLYGTPLSYRSLLILRRMGVDERVTAGIGVPFDGVGGTGGDRSFIFSDELPNRPDHLSLHYAERNYRFGVRATIDRYTRHDWRWVAAADLRMGRDASIEGVFTQAATVGGRLSRRWSRERHFDLFVSLPISMQGLRAATTEEAYRLTDDPWYNPSWGFQNGEVRSARIRREVMPLLMATYAFPLSATTRLRLTASAEGGRRRMSGLGWYDARTPYPDNYRYMPSYTGDVATDAAWRMADARYTQINWDELIAQNKLRGGEAAYTLEDRVEQPLQWHLRAAFYSRLSRVELDYGLMASWQQRRYYKEMRDLLGADYLTDIDYFLIDDDTYGNRLQNDLRNPSRRIGEGDRFGYDYRLEERRVGGWLRGTWQWDRWQIEGAAEVAEEQVRRRGYYEKELFAGEASYGPSRAVSLTTYALKGAVSYAFAANEELELTLALGTCAPEASDLFIQPQYNNRTIDSPTVTRYYGGQLMWRRVHPSFSWQVTAFLTASFDGVESSRYYDDLAGVYSDLTVAGLAQRTLGIEAVAEWRPHRRWRFTASLAWNDCRYVRDAEVTVVADTDNRPIDSRAVSRLGDCRPGGVPALATSLRARAYWGKGWSTTLSLGVVTDRYVEPSALRRTDRVAQQNGSTPELFARYTTQERLDDAVSVDVGLYKSIRFNNETVLYGSLQLQNLLGEEMISYGYESMRSQRIGVGDQALRVPQASRYLYASPRSILLTIGYRF